MSGFSLSVAAHVLRYGIRSWAAKIVFLLFLVSSLLFLIALYVDVRLSIELAGVDSLPDETLKKISSIRNIGTGCATVALFMFVAATAFLGWVATPFTGFLSTVVGGFALYTLWYIWDNINSVSIMLQKI